MPKLTCHIINQTENFDIKLLHCGIEKESAGESINAPIDRYVLVGIFDGMGTYSLNGKTYPIKKGDVLFIPSNMPYATCAEEGKPFKHYYVAFVGPSSLPLAKHAGLTLQHPVVETNGDFVKKKMARIFNLMADHSFSSIMKANIVFFEILHYLFTLIPENNMAQKRNPNAFIQRVENYVQDHYNEDITVNEISHALYVNRTYLSSLFKKLKGMTLKNYITTYRIYKSFELLLDSDLSITEIAIRTGFNNSVSYYRQFKAITSRSPKEYRRENRKAIELSTYTSNQDKNE